VRREMSSHPVAWEETMSMLPWQHVMVFRKPE
jgi:hypothetical protein